MWFAAVRDLLWRRRRYLISVVGTSLVFGLSLLMSGISASFAAEPDTVADQLGAQGFLVPDGVSGPFTGSRPFDPSGLPDGAEPMAFQTQTAGGDDPLTVAVIGVPSGSPALRVVSGRPPGPGEAIVSGDAPFDTGATVDVGGNPLRVAGRIGAASLNAGMPLVLVPLDSFQESFLGGQSLATAATVRSPGVTPSDGFRSVTLDEARADTLRILESAIQTIDLIKLLLWTVAALIVGSVVFLSAVERTRDFAVFKAIGASTRSMAGGVALQAAVLSLAATGLGIAVAALLAPVFPLRVTLTGGSLVAMPLIALAIGLLASLFGLRRAVGVEPALAFGGAV